MLCIFGFVDDVIFLYNGADSIRRRYVWSNSAGDGTSRWPHRELGRGEVCYPRLPC